MEKNGTSTDKNNESSPAILNNEEETEQIGKDIIIGRKETYYEDDRNVISVIINAISVRINMPRGTVKTLMAILVGVVSWFDY